MGDPHSVRLRQVCTSSTSSPRRSPPCGTRSTTTSRTWTAPPFRTSTRSCSCSSWSTSTHGPPSPQLRRTPRRHLSVHYLTICVPPRQNSFFIYSENLPLNVLWLLSVYVKGIFLHGAGAASAISNPSSKMSAGSPEWGFYFILFHYQPNPLLPL